MPLTSANIQLLVTPRVSTHFGPQTAALDGLIATLGIGTDASAVDSAYWATRSAGTSGDTLDLNAGGLYQPDNTAFSIVDLVALAVVNRDDTNTLTIGGGTNAVANVAFTLKPGTSIVFFSILKPAYAVTATTGDNLKFTASAGTVAYDVLILGRSA